MKASEARAISESNGIKFFDILKGIKERAEEGESCLYTDFNKPISVQFIADLVGLGYSVKEHTDPRSGFKMYVISW